MIGEFLRIWCLCAHSCVAEGARGEGRGALLLQAVHFLRPRELCPPSLDIRHWERRNIVALRLRVGHVDVLSIGLPALVRGGRRASEMLPMLEEARSALRKHFHLRVHREERGLRLRERHPLRGARSANSTQSGRR